MLNLIIHNLSYCGKPASKSIEWGDIIGKNDEVIHTQSYPSIHQESISFMSSEVAFPSRALVFMLVSFSIVYHSSLL